MTLKVIRYKNYGCQMTSEDDQHKFYFSFYELNNRKIIEFVQSEEWDFKVWLRKIICLFPELARSEEKRVFRESPI